MPYREPGREPDPEKVPTPTARSLLLPFGVGALAVAALVVPLLLLNVLFVPDAGSPMRAVRLTPAMDTFETVIALVMLGSFIASIAVIARRVAPQWSGLRTWQKLGYVGAVLAVQGAVTLGGEAALFQSRGGLELFGPTWKASYDGPHGASAHVLGAAGLGCGYELFVSEPLSPTMHRVQHVTGHCADKTSPNVSWAEETGPVLVDAAGAPLKDEPTRPLFFGWGGGC